MTKATHLASELLVQIFNLVPANTQINCQLVCKAWHNPAKQLFFSSIHIHQDTRLVELIRSLETTGALVRSLKIGKHNQLDINKFNHLIRACSTIYVLQLDNNTYSQWLLSNFSVPLDKLRKISVSSFWRSTPPYFYSVAYRYRQSIEELHVPCTCSTVLDLEFGGILNYLNSFENLKYLTMIDGSQRVLVYFDQLFNVCKKLETLVIELGHPLYDPKDNHQSMITTLAYPTLKTLQLFLTKFSIHYFRYIMNRFVNLNVFDVRINQPNSDWEKDKFKIAQFLILEYLPFIYRLKQSSLSIKMNGTCTLDEFMADFLNHLKQHTTSKVQFQIENGRSERTDIKLETTTTTTNQHSAALLMNYVLVRNFFIYEQTGLPYARHLTSYGQSIQSLKINLSKSVLKSIDLSFILTECPNLQDLLIQIEQKRPSEPPYLSTTIMNESTPNLIYFNSSQRLLCHSKLIFLNLEGVLITPHFLNALSNQVKSLDTIHLIHCSFHQLEKYTEFDMSNSNIRHFILDNTLQLPESTCFILSQLNQPEKSFYHYTPVKQETLLTSVSLEFKFESSLVSMRILIGNFPHQQTIQI
ncbi:hypothetical protein BD770DRAFT_379157, partial [Pilaira anomala]